MSEIGASNYFLVGCFHGVPLYQPLWPISIGQGEFDRRKENAEPGHLVLGGGSGEHPAIIFRNLDCCAAAYLCSKWNLCVRPTTDIEQALDAGLAQHARTWLEYCAWSSTDHRDFYERCRYEYERVSDYFSFRRQDDAALRDPETGVWLTGAPQTSFEMWLCLNVGQFIYSALPDISPRIREWRERLGPVTHPFFCSITIPVPGDLATDGSPGQKTADDAELRTRGGMPRWRIVDRFPGYHSNPDWWPRRVTE